MSAPVYPTAEYIRRLDLLILGEYPIIADKSQVHLYQNDITPDENSTLVSFEEADYSGYSGVEIAMNAPSMNDTGMIVSKSNLVNFSSAAGVDPQTVFGIFITNPDGDELIAAQRFDTPQQMGGVYPQAITGVWRTSEPLSTYGWIDVEN